MQLLVLGSAAGGGFPQWNCNCRNCVGARDGSVRTRRRTQSSIAVRGEGDARWVLVNASPDVLAQIHATPALHGADSPRDTRIGAIVFVDGQIDHTAGLLMLREATQPWHVWCTDRVYSDLTSGFPILNVMSSYCGVERHRIGIDDSFSIDQAPGLRWRVIAVDGKPAPYSQNRAAPARGDNIAILIQDAKTGRTILYAPGLARIDANVRRAMSESDCVLVDGTFWSETEMADHVGSASTANDMGHLPQSGAGGMIAALDALPRSTRRILIHINNTNPVLDEGSRERALLQAHGIEVAHDGMDLSL